MKKSVKGLIAVGCVVVVLAGCFGFYKIKNPTLKGIKAGADSIEYKGVTAVKYDFFTDFNDAEYIGKSEDGDYEVYVTGDKDKPDLFTLQGDSETLCYKAEDYKIADSGEVTKVFVNPAVRGKNEYKVSEKDDLEMFEKLVSDTGNVTHTFHIKDIDKYGKKFYFAYENNPVSQEDNLGGYVAYTSADGWIYVNAEYYNSAEIKTEGKVSSADFTGWKIPYSDVCSWLENSSFGIKPQSFRK